MFPPFSQRGNGYCYILFVSFQRGVYAIETKNYLFREISFLLRVDSPLDERQNYYGRAHPGYPETTNATENNKPRDIDVASIEAIQSFLKFYIDYYIIEEKDVNAESGWGDVTKRLQAFFMARSSII